MTTQRKITPKSQRKSTRPEGWIPAGAKVPVKLTVRQKQYCRRGKGTSVTFKQQSLGSTHGTTNRESKK